MRLIMLVASLVFVSGALAQVLPEEITMETMPEHGTNWFIVKSGNGARIFSAETGEMFGTISLSNRTPAVAPYLPRGEFYAAESYYSRGVHGGRTDIVAIYDYANLNPVAEIEIPNHMARLPVRAHLGLLGNGRHLAVLNMNPGYSVSIVDVVDREFVYEMSTPGCAIILPVAENDFLLICGDGTLQLSQLDISGFEENRVRSEVFFNVQEDAVFDRAARTADGWLLITHAGVIFEVSTDDDEIDISEGWSIVGEDESGWRPGGFEFLDVHRDSGLLYVAMHEGPVDTHHEPGDEIWVIDLAGQRRAHRLELEDPADHVTVTQESAPKLIVGANSGSTEIYNALTFEHERSIDGPGASMYGDF